MKLTLESQPQNTEFFSHYLIYLKTVDHLLIFQRCIIIGLYYLILKQVNNYKCITAARGSLGYIPV